MRFPQLLRPDEPYLLQDLTCQNAEENITVADSSYYNADAWFSNGQSQDYSDFGPGMPLYLAFNGTTMLGANEVINLLNGFTIPLSAEWTIQWFAKRDSTSNHDRLLSTFEDASFWGYQSGGHTIYFDADGASAQTLSLTGIVDTTTWHHVAMIFKSNNTIDVYINGASAGTLSGTRASAAYFQVITDSSLSLFRGKFCGIKIYQQTRTALQILTDASQGQIGDGTKKIEINLQDNAGSSVLNDTSVYDVDGSLSANNSSTYSVLDGPGNTLSRSFDGPTLWSEGEALTLASRYTTSEFMSDMTFECFFRFTSIADPTYLRLSYEVDGDDGFKVTATGGNFVFATPSSTGTATVAGANTRWHHVAFKVGWNNDLSGLLDGKQTLEFDAGWSANINVDALASWVVHSSLNGRFCGYRIHNKILTDAEIKESAKRGAIGRICPTSLSLLGVG